MWLWTRRFQFDTTIGYFCQDSGTLPLDVGKTIQSVFFEKKSIYFKSSSDHVDCSFGNSVKFVLSVTPKILAQSPKVWKVLFLLEKCPAESSAGHLECLSDETGALLQIGISSEEPRKYIKLYLLPNNFFKKCFTGHVHFSFYTLVENICQRQELLYSESANRVRIMFFSKKNVLSQSVSLDTWNAFLTNLLKMFRQENGFSLLIAQRSKSFGFSRKFFFEMFRWTRRMPNWRTWSFLESHNFLGKTIKWYKLYLFPDKLFSKCSSRHEDSGLDTLVEYFSKNPEILSSKSANSVQFMIFSEKKFFCLEVFLWTHEVRCWKLRLKLLAWSRLFLAHCPKVEMFWFQPKFFPGNVDTFGEKFCQKTGISNQYQKKIKIMFFFEKKINFINDFHWHTECGDYSSAKIVSPKNGIFSLNA